MQHKACWWCACPLLGLGIWLHLVSQLCRILLLLSFLSFFQSALQELEELKQIVPKESLVYFLIGKVYKKLGQTHLALMNFSWAMDLDPKGANNQIKEAIDKRYLPDDEEPITQEEQIMGTDESQESSMTDADDTQLHAAESDEF